MRVKVRFVWVRIYDTGEDYQWWTKANMINDALEEIPSAVCTLTADDLEVEVLES